MGGGYSVRSAKYASWCCALTSCNPISLASSGQLVGTTIAGRYKVECLLGSGGVGSVYLVQHTNMHKFLAPVALFGLLIALLLT